ncbi:hypothetical protein INF26_06630 [Olsenella sp. DSM 107455]|uniref:PA14 domain-containing protein n=1 Tax=Thermophilibacter gallinarum TaxID=2779357 RepID=A0ABR9QTW7_9ACTN|nr:FctA domain-containing protein [Thermophilibacter gallinarum]MBE5024523.1 hypothetical protein [Thermophilibacter gallinarum]
MRNLLTRRSSGGRARARLNGSRAAIVLAGVLVAFVAVLGVTSVAWAALSEHTVTGVSPRGTTINLFDYWITGQIEPDNVDYTDDQADQGINAGHTLKFGKSMGESEDPFAANTGNVNQWTKSAHPRTGIVASGLDEDGYPVMSQTFGSAPLDYLFNSASVDGKAAYTDVKGLLQVDDEGYYYYNSQENFAQFNVNGESGSFVLYDTWGVAHTGSSPDGQFFPFNTGAEVFDDNSDGGITQKDGITSTSEIINHYFGVHMSTRFVQQYGGHNAPDGTAGQREVTYNFSGDDDVWIFIDGVLVGDLGGIHDATSIEINFATGNVVVYEDTNGNYQWDNGDTVYSQNTLKSLFALNGDTFDDNTYHTLDFFYLERGNTDSNMYLKYNLVNIPESGVVKVDQYGDELPGVEFTLTEADSSYQPAASAASVSGVTNANGEMIFTYRNDAGQEIPITLEQMGERSGYWILEETEGNTTIGYRNPGVVKLRFSKINGDGTGDGVLLSSNQWDTGAYSQAHVTATATTTISSVGGGATYDPADGLMFAVVTKINDGAHYAVTGDAFNGWNVATTAIDDVDTNKDAIVSAAKASGYAFVLGSGGAYQTTIEDLPGDVTTYEYMIENGQGTGEPQYAVKYYWSDATSFDDLTVASTIVEVDPDAGQGFDRMFSVTLSIPNIKNELTLVKTDEATGNPIQGVTFNMYDDENGNGVYDADERRCFSGTTDANGTLNITSNTYNGKSLLDKGEYVLVEEALSGYVNEGTSIRVIVDDDGVHVDAGKAGDNVTVETGIGDLVYSLRSFAADDQIDATLHEVKAQPQTATTYEGASTAWNGSGGELHFQYQDKNDENALTYQPSDNSDATYTADAGWSRLDVTQCWDHGSKDYKKELGDQSLNGIFSGDVTIHVTNRKLSSLTVEKKVTGTGAPADAVFEFTLELTDANGPISGTFEAETTHADGSIPTTQQFTFSADTTENSFTIKNGDRITIKGLPADTTYTVTEAATDYYDQSVSPDAGSSKTGDGLASTGTIASDPATVEFTNTFWGGSVDYDQAVGVDISKIFTGRDMKPGETFTINVQPKDTASAALLGLKDENDVLPIEFSGLSDGVRATNDLTAGKNIVFTEGNVGTYTYTVSEVRPADDPIDGVAYDDTVYTLTIEATVDGDGVVTVTTSATDGDGFDKESTVSGSRHKNSAIELSFANTYTAAPDDGEQGGDQGGTTPDDPKDTIPRTGDDSFAHAPTLALLGAAVVAGGVVLRRRLTRE